jgi:hypothetical protein
MIAPEAAFNRAWANFNQAAGFGDSLTKPAFSLLVLRAPELFAAYVVEAAKWYDGRHWNPRRPGQTGKVVTP